MGHWWPLILSSPDPALPPGLWWWAQWRSRSRRGCQRPTAWLPTAGIPTAPVSAHLVWPGSIQHGGSGVIVCIYSSVVAETWWSWTSSTPSKTFCESVQFFESFPSPWAQKPMYKALRPQRYPIAWVQPTMASCPLIPASLYLYTERAMHQLGW